MKSTKPIYVTQPSMPPLEEFTEYLKQIWDSKLLTNNGRFHRELEQSLCEYLGVKYISLFSNGTLALITALQVLRITGEVITTPFSFVATTHSLWWNRIKTVFADIDPLYCNLDPDKIEAAITPQTTAILPVHVYGNPCNIEKIQSIADTYGLKTIYDAAHAFGVKYKGQSVMNYGDLSILSFHATKTFNTFEGGAIICHDEKTKQRIDYLKNFGFAGETKVIAPGINAKMNEVQAAMGLLQLKYFEEGCKKRELIYQYYEKGLNNINGISIIKPSSDVNWNYSYFPIFINKSEYGMSRDALYEKLQQHNIYGRRYFYPLISEFSPYKALPSASNTNLPISTQKAQQVLCLPIYSELGFEIVDEILKIVTK